MAVRDTLSQFSCRVQNSGKHLLDWHRLEARAISPYSALPQRVLSVKDRESAWEDFHVAAVGHKSEGDGWRNPNHCLRVKDEEFASDFFEAMNRHDNMGTSVGQDGAGVGAKRGITHKEPD